MEDNKNPIAIHSQEQPPLKTFFNTILQMIIYSTHHAVCEAMVGDDDFK
jgi:hypothetical protein